MRYFNVRIISTLFVSSVVTISKYIKFRESLFNIMEKKKKTRRSAYIRSFRVRTANDWLSYKSNGYVAGVTGGNVGELSSRSRVAFLAESSWTITSKTATTVA